MLDQPPDQRSDIFSLGVVFYEALSGTHPFRRRTVFETADSVLHTEPEPLTKFGVETRLSDIIARMIVKDPAARYQNVADVVSDLQAFAKTAQTETMTWHVGPRTAAKPKWKSFVSRYKLLISGALIIVVLVMAFGPLKRQVSRVPRVLGISKAPQVAVLSFQSIGG